MLFYNSRLQGAVVRTWYTGQAAQVFNPHFHSSLKVPSQLTVATIIFTSSERKFYEQFYTAETTGILKEQASTRFRKFAQVLLQTKLRFYGSAFVLQTAILQVFAHGLKKKFHSASFIHPRGYSFCTAS